MGGIIHQIDGEGQTGILLSSCRRSLVLFGSNIFRILCACDRLPTFDHVFDDDVKEKAAAANTTQEWQQL